MVLSRLLWVTLVQAQGIRLGEPSVVARAAGRLVGFHVSDWLVPVHDILMNRGMMGDGVIELRRIRAAVEGAGYAGPIEVEIFNQGVWDTPLDSLVPLVKERYLACV